MNKNFFEIVTLSDCMDCNKKGLPKMRYSGLKDVSGVIGGVLGVINGILSLFGSRKKLTRQDLDQMFPGSGYWSNRLKDYIATRIGYVEDLAKKLPNGQTYLEGVIDNFIHLNFNALSKGKWKDLEQNASPGEWQRIKNEFFQTIQNEGQGKTNGNGYSQAGFGEIGLVPLLILGGLAFSFFSTPTKSRKVKR